MSGLLLLLVATVWFVISVLLVIRATRWIKAAGFRVFAGLVVFPVVLMLPLADEVVGMWQFKALCRQYAVEVIDDANSMNRRVVFEGRGTDRYADGTAVSIRIDPYVFRDEQTGEVLVSFHILTATGGWLIRTLGISETSAPLIFRSTCAPPDAFGFRQRHNITVIN